MIKKFITFIFGNKDQKIKKSISKKYEQAIKFQRNGNIEAYSNLMKEISELEDKIKSE